MKITDRFFYKFSVDMSSEKVYEMDDPKLSILSTQITSCLSKIFDTTALTQSYNTKSHESRKRLPKYTGEGPFFKSGQVLASKTITANQRRLRRRRQREHIIL